MADGEYEEEEEEIVYQPPATLLTAPTHTDDDVEGNAGSGEGEGERKREEVFGGLSNPIPTRLVYTKDILLALRRWDQECPPPIPLSLRRKKEHEKEGWERGGGRGGQHADSGGGRERGGSYGRDGHQRDTRSGRVDTAKGRGHRKDFAVDGDGGGSLWETTHTPDFSFVDQTREFDRLFRAEEGGERGRGRGKGDARHSGGRGEGSFPESTPHHTHLPSFPLPPPSSSSSSSSFIPTFSSANVVESEFLDPLSIELPPSLLPASVHFKSLYFSFLFIRFEPFSLTHFYRKVPPVD
jgi:hypothetical protein